MLIPAAPFEPRHPLKITVLRIMETSDILDYIPESQVSHAPSRCARLEENQSFLVNEYGECEGGFPCAWAWHDLHPVIRTMQAGGQFVMKKRKGIQYACCTDGLMPVIFRLEYVMPVAGHLHEGQPDLPWVKEGNTRIPLKITVTKTLLPTDIYGDLPEGASQPQAHILHEGDTFIVTENGLCPQGFPDAVWHDIYAQVLTLQLGGNMEGFRKGLSYACSSNGLAPVFFRLERMHS